MPRFAAFEDYQQVKLKEDREAISNNPFTELESARPVLASDRGVIVMVEDEQTPVYQVEFFDANGRTVDVLEVREDEIEAWE